MSNITFNGTNLDAIPPFTLAANLSSGSAVPQAILIDRTPSGFLQDSFNTSVLSIAQTYNVNPSVINNSLTLSLGTVMPATGSTSAVLFDPGFQTFSQIGSTFGSGDFINLPAGTTFYGNGTLASYNPVATIVNRGTVNAKVNGDHINGLSGSGYIVPPKGLVTFFSEGSGTSANWFASSTLVGDVATSDTSMINAIQPGVVTGGAVGTSKLAQNTVAYNNIQTVSPLALLGNGSSGAGMVGEILLGSGLSISGWNGTNGTLNSTGGTGGSGVSSIVAGTGLTANGTTGGTLTSPGTIAMGTTGVSPGTYNQIVVDALGRVTVGTALNYLFSTGSATNTAIPVFNGTVGTSFISTQVLIDGTNNITGVNSLTAAAIFVGTNPVLSGTTGVTSGIYGNGSNIPQFNVDVYGRITSAGNTPIAFIGSNQINGSVSGLQFVGTNLEVALGNGLSLNSGSIAVTLPTHSGLSLGGTGLSVLVDGSTIVNNSGTLTSISSGVTSIIATGEATGTSEVIGGIGYVAGTFGLGQVANPRNIAFSTDGSKAFVMNCPGTTNGTTVTYFNTETFGSLGTINLGTNDFWNIAVGLNNTKLVATNIGNGTVNVYDISTGTIQYSVAPYTASYPEAVGVATYGTLAYTTIGSNDGADDTRNHPHLVAVDLTTGSIVFDEDYSVTGTGGGCSNVTIAPNGSYLVVSSQSEDDGFRIFTLNGSTGIPGTSFIVGHQNEYFVNGTEYSFYYADSVISPDSGTIYIQAYNGPGLFTANAGGTITGTYNLGTGNSPGYSGISISNDGSLLYATNGSTLTLVKTSDFSILGTIATPNIGQQYVNPISGQVYAADGSNSVYVINPTTTSSQLIIDLSLNYGALPIGTSVNPTDVIALGQNGTVIQSTVGSLLAGPINTASLTASNAIIGSNLIGSNAGDQSILASGDATGSALAAIPSVINTFAVAGTAVQGIAFTASGSRAASISRTSGTNTLNIINANTNTVVGSLNFNGSTCADIVIAPNQDVAYVTEFSAFQVTQILLGTDNNGTQINQFSTYNNPTDIAITRDGSYVLTTCLGDPSHRIWYLNTSTAGTGTFYSNPGEGNGVACSPIADYAYTTALNDNSLIKISTAGSNFGSILGTISLNGASPMQGLENIDFSPDGKLAYVSVYDYSGSFLANQVYVVNNTTFTQEGIITVGTGGNSASFNSNSRTAYISNGADNTLSIINVANSSIIETLSVGSNPGAPATNPISGITYIPNSGTNTISVISSPTQLNLSLTLDTVNADVGTFGGTASYPIITVNAKGLITAVTSQSVASSFNGDLLGSTLTSSTNGTINIGAPLNMGTSDIGLSASNGINFNGLGSANWRMGMNLPFNTSTVGANGGNYLAILFDGAAGTGGAVNGFAIGNTQSDHSVLEITSDGTVLFPGPWVTTAGGFSTSNNVLDDNVTGAASINGTLTVNNTIQASNFASGASVSGVNTGDVTLNGTTATSVTLGSTLAFSGGTLSFAANLGTVNVDAINFTGGTAKYNTNITGTPTNGTTPVAWEQKVINGTTYYSPLYQ